MWIMTTEGFYSVVEHRADPDLLLVRCRAEKDLVHAQRTLDGTLSEDSTIRYDGHADYPWRMLVHREDWALAVARMTHAVDYDNFKSAVGRVDHERASVYHHVWSALTRIERNFSRRYYGPPERRWPDLFSDVHEPAYGFTADVPSRSVARSARKRAKRAKKGKS